MDRLLKLDGTDLDNKRNRELAKQTRWGRFHISVGPKILQQVTESLQAHLGETEIPLVRPNWLVFLVVGMLIELGGAG